MFEDIFVKSGYHNYVILRDDYYLGDGNIRYNHITNEIEFIDIDLTFVTSWAIGTPNNDGTIELLVACNEPLTGIKFVNRHIRPDVKEIGDRNLLEEWAMLDNGHELSVDMTYVRGKEVQETIDFGYTLQDIDITYYRSKEIGETIDLDFFI